MTTRPTLKIAAGAQGSQVPLTQASAPIRDRLALERQRLDAIAPDALDIAASILAALHAELRGELAGLAADRTPRYRRGQLLGEHGLVLEDLCYLAVQRPAVVARALEQLTKLEPERQDGESLTAAGSSLMQAMGSFAASFIGALEDGKLTRSEITRLFEQLAAIEDKATAIRHTLLRTRS